MNNTLPLIIIALTASAQIPGLSSGVVYASDLKNTVIDLSPDRDPRTPEIAPSKEDKPSFLARAFNFKGMAWKMLPVAERRKRLVQAITSSLNEPNADPGGFIKRYLTPQRIQEVAQKVADSELAEKKSLRETEQSVAKSARLEFAQVITGAILEEQAKEVGGAPDRQLREMRERITADLQSCLQDAQNSNEIQGCLAKFTRSVPFRISAEIFPILFDQKFADHWSKISPPQEFRTLPWIQFQRCAKESYFDVLDRGALSSDQIPVILQGCMLSSFVVSFDQLILASARNEIGARGLKSLNPEDAQAQARSCLRDANLIESGNGEVLSHFNQQTLQRTDRQEFERILIRCQDQVVEGMARNVLRAVIRENPAVIQQFDPKAPGHGAKLDEISDTVFFGTYNPCIKKGSSASACERTAKIQAANLILEQVVIEKEAYVKLFALKNAALDLQIRADLKAAFAAHFLPCLQNQTAPELQFGICIDRITIEAGRIGAFWTLMQNASIQKVMPDAQARKQFTHSILEQEKVYEECIGHLKEPKKPELCKGLIIHAALRSIILQKVANGVRTEAFPEPVKKSKKPAPVIQCESPMKGQITQQKAYCDSQARLQGCFASMKPQIISELEADIESDSGEIMRKAASCIVDSVSLASFYLTAVKIEEQRVKRRLSKAELPARSFQNQAQKCYAEKLQAALSKQADPFPTIEESVRLTQNACVALIQPRVERAVTEAIRKKVSAGDPLQSAIKQKAFDVMLVLNDSSKSAKAIPSASAEDGSSTPAEPTPSTEPNMRLINTVMEKIDNAYAYFSRSQSAAIFDKSITTLKNSLGALQPKSRDAIVSTIAGSPFTQNLMMAISATEIQKALSAQFQPTTQEDSTVFDNILSNLTSYDYFVRYFSIAMDNSLKSMTDSIRKLINGKTQKIDVPDEIKKSLGEALTFDYTSSPSFTDTLFGEMLRPVLKQKFQEYRSQWQGKIGLVQESDFSWEVLRKNAAGQMAIKYFADILKGSISGSMNAGEIAQKKELIKKSLYDSISELAKNRGLSILLESIKLSLKMNRPFLFP